MESMDSMMDVRGAILARIKMLEQVTEENTRSQKRLAQALSDMISVLPATVAHVAGSTTMQPDNYESIPGTHDPCSLILRLEPGMSNVFRGLSQDQMRERVQSAINRGVIDVTKARRHGQILLTDCKQLNNGDLEIHTSSFEDAHRLSADSSRWCHLLWASPQDNKMTYGIVVHNINTRTFGNIDTEEEMSMAKRRIFTQNMGRLSTLDPEDIVSIEWLVAERRTKHRTSIVVEFCQARQANECIARKLIIDNELHRCVIRSHHIRLTQCSRCWLFGHPGSCCAAVRRCGRCSEKGHGHSRCSKPSTMVSCINCQGPHYAFDRRCPVAVKEKAKNEKVRGIDANPNLKRLWQDADYQRLKQHEEMQPMVTLNVANAHQDRVTIASEAIGVSTGAAGRRGTSTEPLSEPHAADGVGVVMQTTYQGEQETIPSDVRTTTADSESISPATAALPTASETMPPPPPQSRMFGVDGRSRTASSHGVPLITSESLVRNIQEVFGLFTEVLSQQQDMLNLVIPELRKAASNSNSTPIIVAGEGPLQPSERSQPNQVQIATRPGVSETPRESTGESGWRDQVMSPVLVSRSASGKRSHQDTIDPPLQTRSAKRSKSFASDQVATL